MNFPIFDAEVHYGKSEFGPDCDIDLYLKNSMQNLKKVLIVPSPTHNWLKDGVREISVLWREEGSRVIYEKIVETKSEKKVEKDPRNPYLDYNKDVLRKFRELNKMSKIKFYVVPKVHPILDDENALMEIIKDPLFKAIKIHGLAAHSGPSDIPSWVVEKSKKYNKPFFVHTDYFSGPPKSALHKLMNLNSSRNWFDWVVDNKVRAYLAHGARLDREVLKEARKNRKVVFGVGPETLLDDEENRLKTKTKNYLKTLMEFSSSKSLVFSTDFRWNVKKRENWDDLDWETPRKIITLGEEIGLTKKEVRNILYDNANEFFACLE